MCNLPAGSQVRVIGQDGVLRFFESTGGITGIQIVNATVVVPEPATAMLLGLAVAGLTMSRRNRRQNA